MKFNGLPAITAVAVTALAVGYVAGGAASSGAPVIERIHPQAEGLSWADHFTRVVISRGGKLVFISPMAATGADGKIVGIGDIETQARHIYKKLAITLAAAGAAPADVVMHHSYVVGLEPADGAILARLMADFYPEGARPAAALLGIDTLINPDLELEIGVWAVVPD